MKSTFHSNFKALLIYVMSTLLLTYCTSTHQTADLINPVTDWGVSTSHAMNIANIFRQINSNPNARISAESVQDSSQIESLTTLSDENLPVFHLITYKNAKGWILISADRRMTPVLAYATSGKLNFSNPAGGLSLWVDGVKDILKNARNKLTTPNDIIENRWKHFEKKGGINAPGGELQPVIVHLMINICISALQL